MPKHRLAKEGNVFTKLKPYRKAIVAAAIAGLTALYAAMADDKVSTGELIMIALALAGGGGVTWAVPNAPNPTVRDDDAPAERHVL